MLSPATQDNGSNYDASTAPHHEVMERFRRVRRLLQAPGAKQTVDFVMNRIRPTSVALGVAIILMGVCLTKAAERSTYETILLEKNIQPTSSALSKYLRELHPDEGQLDSLKTLVEQLGDNESFQAREAAMAKLLVMPTLPTEELLLAAQGDDPEIRWRARKVLNIGKPESAKVMYAAFRVIAAEKLSGLVSELLAAIPLCDKRHLLAAANDALVASARKEDTTILRAALSNQNAEVRAGAVQSLENVLGKASLNDIRPAMKDNTRHFIGATAVTHLLQQPREFGADIF